MVTAASGEALTCEDEKVTCCFVTRTYARPHSQLLDAAQVEELCRVHAALPHRGCLTLGERAALPAEDTTGLASDA